MRRLLLLAVLLAATPALAQDARLVLRDAYLPDPYGETGSVPDTTTMERAMLDGQPIYLGAVLMPLAVDSVTVDTDSLAVSPGLLLVVHDADALREVTTRQVGRALAVVLDGRVLVAPVVREPIAGGRVQISGAFTAKETFTLALQIQEATGAALIAKSP
jgi:preprotein translocase subunit SecD